MIGGHPSHRAAAVRERAQVARERLLEVDGVVDIVLGGSVGRGEEWAFSDIDLIPITSTEPSRVLLALGKVRRELALGWASSGQVVDVGRLAFTVDEAKSTAEGGAQLLASRVSDPRWLHGTDKAAGGAGANATSVGTVFAAALARSRLDTVVRRARFIAWMTSVDERISRARAVLAEGRLDEALMTAQVAGPLAAAILETWAEREGSMSKFASHFERTAHLHDAPHLLAAIQSISMSATKTVLADVPEVPEWLEERVELAYEARIDVGESVTTEQNRRDMILLALGEEGLPDPITRLRRHHPDEAAYIDMVATIVEEVRALEPTAPSR